MHDLSKKQKKPATGVRHAPVSFWSHISLDFVTGLPTSPGKTVILSPCRNCLLHLSLLNCFQVRWNLSRNRIRPGAPVHLMSLEGFLHHSRSLGIFEFWLSSTNKRQKGSTMSLRPCSASLHKIPPLGPHGYPGSSMLIALSPLLPQVYPHSKHL